MHQKVDAGTQANNEERAEAISTAGFKLSSSLDKEGTYTALLPIVLMVVLQLWAVLGTSHHPQLRAI